MSFRATTVLVRLDHKQQTRHKALTGKYRLRLGFCLETLPRKLQNGNHGVREERKMNFRVIFISSAWAFGASALVYGATNWGACYNLMYSAAYLIK
jgi:hypothetical protein